MNRKQFIFTVLLALLSGLMGGVLSVWFLAPPSVLAQDEPPKVIEAQEFRVVDDGGIVRAQLSVSGDEASLTFAHPTGDRPLLEIFARSDPSDSSHISIRDSNGEERATLGFNENLKLSHLNLYGPQTTAGTGTPAEVSLHISPDLTQLLSGGEARVIPEVTLSGAGQFSNISLEVPTDGPRLSIDNEDLQPRVILGSTRLRNNRTGSTEIRAPSSLVLLDEEGKVVWSAP